MLATQITVKESVPSHSAPGLERLRSPTKKKNGVKVISIPVFKVPNICFHRHLITLFKFAVNILTTYRANFHDA